jgi:hypothetical protein
MKTPLAEPEIVTRKGKPVSVILPIKAYEELLGRVEDAEDMAMLKRARKTPLRYRPLEDYLKDRGRRDAGNSAAARTTGESASVITV